PSADEPCRGTLAPSAVRILTALCCYSSQDPHSNAVHRTSRPDFDPRTTPPYKITFRCSAGSVTDLSPLPFRGPLSRRVSCNAIFERRLLLSPHPSCLRPRTPFGIRTECALRALSCRLGGFPYGCQDYPRHPTPGIYGDHGFGVRQGTDGFLRLSAQSVALPHGRPPPRSSCD